MIYSDQYYCPPFKQELNITLKLAKKASFRKRWVYGGKVEENMGLWRLSPGKFRAMEAKHWKILGYEG